MEQNSTRSVEVKDKECVVLLDPFSFLCAGMYRSSFTSKRTVLLSFAEAQFESTECLMIFESVASKKDFLNKVSSIAVLKARLRQWLSHTASAEKRLVRDELF